MLHFSISLLKDSKCTIDKHDYSQRMRNIYLEYENFDLYDPAVAQNFENGNRILTNISNISKWKGFQPDI